ncbi:hypothetical protein Hamer_G018696 [Homarus americanus]|uniref:Uncharacterized protein n=1 Tax=Homarus americanus TaxID=6706 RepID=A0A8J5N5R4_HOMAM|nr:hypothetical protein Hamer_G018696 [Homarus americanus]
MLELFRTGPKVTYTGVAIVCKRLPFHNAGDTWQSFLYDIPINPELMIMSSTVSPTQRFLERHPCVVTLT